MLYTGWKINSNTNKTPTTEVALTVASYIVSRVFQKPSCNFHKLTPSPSVKHVTVVLCHKK